MKYSGSEKGEYHAISLFYMKRKEDWYRNISSKKFISLFVFKHLV